MPLTVPVNSGTGKLPGEERLIEQRIITITLRHGPALLLPVKETP